MREIRQSGSEGGVAVTRHPYPYYEAGPLALEPTGPVALGQTGRLDPPQHQRCAPSQPRPAAWVTAIRSEPKG